LILIIQFELMQDAVYPLLLNLLAIMSKFLATSSFY
jgi:hypothetical protein